MKKKTPTKEKLLKVGLYILVSVFITVVSSEILWQLLEVKIPAEYYGLVNLILVAIAEQLKKQLSYDNPMQKVL